MKRARTGARCIVPRVKCWVVVDDQLRVHGVDGLRVIDASIMPTIASGNTNALAMAIGDRGAELILNEKIDRAD